MKSVWARGFERDCVAIWIGWKISEEKSCGFCQSRYFISIFFIFFLSFLLPLLFLLNSV